MDYQDKIMLAHHLRECCKHGRQRPILGLDEVEFLLELLDKSLKDSEISRNPPADGVDIQ